MMGCFGYICPICGTNIRGDYRTGGEKCIMIHKRHGQEVGRTEGHYDEYGRVIEDTTFRSDDGTHINSHEEICRSESWLSDSYRFGECRTLPNDKRVRFGSDIQIIWQFTQTHTYDELRLHPAFIEIVEKIDTMIQKIPDLYGKNMDVLCSILYDSCEDTKEMHASLKTIYEWADSLPVDIGESGIITVHSKCYQSLSNIQQDHLPFSKPDPNQSCGNIRKKYK